MGESGRADSQLAAIIQGSDDAIISTDLDGIVTSWNPAAEVLYGYLAEEIVGESITLVYPHDELASFDAVLKRVHRGDPPSRLEGVRQRRDGTFVSVEVRVSPMFDPAGAPIGASAIVRDITERNRREAELEESKAFLERTQEIGHIGSWRADIGPEAILHLSSESYRILNLEQVLPIRNLDFYNLVHPDDRKVVIESLIRTRGQNVRSEVEARIVGPNEFERWVLITAEALISNDGVTTGLMGLIQDITHRKAIEIQLAENALYDHLTGLPNRSLMLDRASRALMRSRDSKSNVAVLFLDLDRFKEWDETQGREQGDRLLQAVAHRLRDLVPPTDTVARVSADEFVITCEGITGSGDVAARASRILEHFRRPIRIPNAETVITASIGISIGSSGDEPEALVRDAELAMYRAKERGRDRYELYDFALREQAELRFALEAGLRLALDEGELFMEFQPIASLEHNRFIGAEALLRWKRSDQQILGPEQFISIAEDSGLITPIGAWVIETACQQLRSWQDASPPDMTWIVSINISAAQLRDPNFPRIIEGAIENAGISGECLLLELTESLLVDGALTNRTLHAVRELGPRLSIDDFGTKYSTLSYLKRLPVDELKIDHSFVESIGVDDSSRAVVAAIIALGNALDLRVTAEGVENETQLATLRELGCHAAQGFYLSKPLAGEDCLATLLGELPALNGKKKSRNGLLAHDSGNGTTAAN